MLNIVRLIILMLSFVGISACTGSFVQEVGIDPQLAQKVRQEVPTVTPSDLESVNYASLGMESATDCWRDAVNDEGSSRQDAMDQLR